MTQPSEKRPNVVDSSGWIEYLTDTPNASTFAPAIEDPAALVVPTVSLLEVYRWVLREAGESAALQVAALMQQGSVVDLNGHLALRAAALGMKHSLPLADSVMYATAQAYGATLWTQDCDFENLPDVRYVPKDPS